MNRQGRRAQRVELKHYGGLDGLRGIAVLAVLLYHGGVGWASGGFLGVEVFFVLSGFLITSLLLSEWLQSARIRLRAFWARRARRLLPALFVLIVVIGIYYGIAGPAKAVPGFWGDGLSTLLYFNNWHQIGAGTSYFVASGPVSPFQHTWSLAIEEQFYAFWPLIVLAILWLVARRGAARSQLGALRSLLALTLSGLAISAIEMAVLFDGGAGLDRVYYGTDTRATGLLAGGALAIWLAVRRHSDTMASGAGFLDGIHLDPKLRRRLGAGAPALLLLVLLLMHVADGSSGWLYPLGFLVIDFCTVAAIASVVLLPGSAVDRVLSLAPLQVIGQISYGLYLWHFPLFLWLSTSSTGLSGMHLLMFRLGVTLLVSATSYVFVEQPIRQRRRPTWAIRGLAPLAGGAAVASLFVASTVASLPTGAPAAATLPTPPPPSLQGGEAACTISLTDPPTYGVAPIPLAQEAQFEYAALGHHRLVWAGSAHERFETCPPKRILLIGDSLAFTLGVPMLADGPRYGAEVANAALLGCAFATRGQLDVNGTWESPASDGCADPLAQWAADARRLHPDAVVVELGYRDEFDWRWNGRLVHLGDPVFDAYVESQIERYVTVLGQGATKLLFLTVPYTHPPDQADGAPAPAASPARHATINALLERVAERHPGQVGVVDLDRTISPGNRYAGKVDGQLCRFDGIHFSVFCARLLEPPVLGGARTLMAAGQHTANG